MLKLLTGLPEPFVSNVTSCHVAMNTNVAAKSVPFDTSEDACCSIALSVVDL